MCIKRYTLGGRGRQRRYRYVASLNEYGILLDALQDMSGNPLCIRLTESIKNTVHDTERGKEFELRNGDAFFFEDIWHERLECIND